jgi:hypothetical protein
MPKKKEKTLEELRKEREEEIRKIELEESKMSPEQIQERRKLGCFSPEELRRRADLGLDLDFTNYEEEVEEEEPEESKLGEEAQIKLREIQDKNYRTRKFDLLSKLEAQVNEEESKSAFPKWLDKYEVFHPYVKTLISCLTGISNPRFEKVGKILLVMVRNGDKIDTHVEMYNTDGSETMFDENGDVVEILKSDNP